MTWCILRRTSRPKWRICRSVPLPAGGINSHRQHHRWKQVDSRLQWRWVLVREPGSTWLQVKGQVDHGSRGVQRARSPYRDTWKNIVIKNAPSTCTKRPQTKTPSGKRRQDKMLLFYYSLKEWLPWSFMLGLLTLFKFSPVTFPKVYDNVTVLYVKEF